MKIRAVLIIGLVIVIAAVWVTVYSNLAEDAPVIKIGAVYPLTGVFASYGIEYQRGLEMATEEINSQGGINGKHVELIMEDDGGDTTRSVTAVTKLINVDKAKYIFTAFSSASQATAPIAEQNKVLYVSATVSKIGTGNSVFRDFWDIEDQGTAIGKSLKKEGVKKLGVLAMNFGDTGSFLESLKTEAPNIIITEERFNFGDTDFKTQLAKIKDSDSDAILVYAFPGAEAIKITQQIIELRLEDKRLYSGATTYGLPFMYQQFSGTLERMQAIDSWYSLEVTNQKSAEFTEKYKIKYGQDLIGDAAYPYDDVYALKIAIENAGTSDDTLQVANELRKVDMQGAAGRLTFDEKGNSQRQAYLQIYTSEGWKKYD